MATLEDEYGEYEEDAGNEEPIDGRCNAKLKHWVSRYGEPRYCGQLPESNFCKCSGECDCSDFCKTHSYKDNWRMRAKEMLQHGAYTKTREHLYDKCDVWNKVLMHGLFESLLAESVHEFSTEFEEREFDFSDEDDVPPQANDDDILLLEVPHATEKLDKAKALWCAAVDTVKAINVNAKIAEDMMEVESTEHAQLTSPTEEDPSQTFKTLTEKKEHHLNLAYSRLIRDKKELLSYGGVVTGTEADEESNSKIIEEFTTVEAEPEAIEGEGSGMLDIETPSNDDSD